MEKSLTLKDLRELAKRRGVAGYSRMSKDALAKVLARAQTPPATMPRKKTPAAKNGKRKTNIKAPKSKQANPAPQWNEPARDPTTASVTEEQRIESAKYVARPNGTSTLTMSADLREDIDRLPLLAEPMLCLLPQKPGVLYAYWSLPTVPAHADFKLRVCRVHGDNVLDVQEEIALPERAGSWYFHVPDANQEMVIQLGYYRDDKFVSAITRGVATPPTRYASGRTDPNWWISEDEFRELYVRTGGQVAAPRRYGWSAFGSSNGAAASDDAQPTWPSGASSSSR